MIRALGYLRLALAVLVALGFGGTGGLTWSSRGWSGALWTPLLVAGFATGLVAVTRKVNEIHGDVEALAVGFISGLFVVLLAARDWADPTFGLVVAVPLLGVGALRWFVGTRGRRAPPEATDQPR